MLIFFQFQNVKANTCLRSQWLTVLCPITLKTDFILRKLSSQVSLSKLACPIESPLPCFEMILCQPASFERQTQDLSIWFQCHTFKTTNNLLLNSTTLPQSNPIFSPDVMLHARQALCFRFARNQRFQISKLNMPSIEWSYQFNTLFLFPSSSLLPPSIPHTLITVLLCLVKP